MKFSLWTRYGALNSGPVFESFKKGLETLKFSYVENDYEADVAVIWSVLWEGRMANNKNVYFSFKDRKKPVIILEVGALKRNLTWKVSIESKFYGHETENNDERLKKLGINLMPWRKGENSDKILVCCQNEKSELWSGMPKTEIWIENMLAEIRKITDRPVVLRTHPRFKVDLSIFSKKFKNLEIYQPKKLLNTYDSYDFEENLKNAWCVVNHNSNPSIISLLNGVPVFIGPNNICEKVGNFSLKDIENPKMPDRRQWANDIAYTEWTTEEISQGIPIKRLVKFIKS